MTTRTRTYARSPRGTRRAVVGALALVAMLSACSSGSSAKTTPNASTSTTRSVSKPSTTKSTKGPSSTPSTKGTKGTTVTTKGGTSVTTTGANPGTTVQAGAGGPTALCNDQSYDYQKVHDKVCVGHGGVSFWINEPPQ